MNVKLAVEKLGEMDTELLKNGFMHLRKAQVKFMLKIF